jgi:hypothetical protein
MKVASFSQEDRWEEKEGIGMHFFSLLQSACSLFQHQFVATETLLVTQI